MAEKIIGLGKKNIAVLLDGGNKEYVNSVYDGFKGKFEELGGQVKDLKVLKSEDGSDIEYDKIIKNIDKEIDGVYVLANSLTTSIICQVNYTQKTYYWRWLCICI